MQPEQQELIDAPDESTIRAYLTQNPEFFEHHSDILPSLRIPHHSGSAVSLIEKQVSVLQRKCATLEDNLQSLIAVARENEALNQRLHVLIQEVISAASLDELVALVRERLIDGFGADAVRVVLIEERKGTRHQSESDLFVAWDEPGLALFEKHFARLQTSCGKPSADILDFLYPDQEDLRRDRMASAAIIPLQFGRELGLCVLGSRDPSRFVSEKGVMFLNQLGEVFSRRLATFL